MRLLLPSPPQNPNVVFYEINVSEGEQPASVAISGFDGRHRVSAQADVRADGPFGLTSTQILGENALTLKAGLSETAGALVVIEGTISEQPFEILDNPSGPHVVQAPALSAGDTATLAHWQSLAKGLFVLGLALRSYELHDDPWGPAPCVLMLGAVAVGSSSCLTAASDADALDACAYTIAAADVFITEGACVSSAPPLADVGPR